jgi:hypothetical protein
MLARIIKKRAAVFLIYPFNDPAKLLIIADTAKPQALK